MGQKITEYPQVDYWVKLTREADKRGATLPHRDSADKREVEKFGDMQRARYRSSFSVVLPLSMEKKYDPDDDGDEVVADDAPGAVEDDEEEAEDDAGGASDDEADAEVGGDGDSESA